MSVGLETVNCPLCISDQYESVLSSKDYLFSHETFAVVKCNSCGVLFNNPRIYQSQIGSYYFSDYAPYLADLSDRSLRGIISRIKHKVRQPNYNIINRLTKNKAKSVLEIGSGAGQLLCQLDSAGFDVVGVEMDSKCVEIIHSKGVKCYCGTLETVSDKLDCLQYDAVILNHVFEHLYDPVANLRYLRKILRKGGEVIISIPDISSWEARLFGEYWTGLDLPRHVIHYDRRSIRRLLESEGFEMKKCDSMFFPSSFVESIGRFLFDKIGKMSKLQYFMLYYLVAIFQASTIKIFGSGAITVVAENKGDI